jgi:uncharacterized protein YkwD
MRPVGSKRLLLLLVLTSACATTPLPGSGINPNPPASPPPSPPASPAPPANPVPPPAPSTTADAYLQAINTARSRARSCGTQSFAAAAPLAWSTKLEAAARAHSTDMRDRNYFDHENVQGPTLAQRLATAGYAYRGYGENIAAGYATLDAVMAGWLQSPGHCANIMSPNFTEVGMALVQGGSYRTYWTMDLGRPR